MNEFDGKLINLFKVIRGKEKAVCPVKTQPVHVVDDRLHEFERFAGRICVIHPQIAGTLILCSNTEIETDGLGMAYMEIPVWLRWKTGGNAPSVFICFIVVVNNLTNKIGWCGNIGWCHDLYSFSLVPWFL